MALDAISLRKLPWENSWDWMEDYLVREERLFAERVESAAAAVQRLAEAIEAFKEETGEYPASLEELEGREGLARSIPLDPWGQHYRYRVPGANNPEGFDVWSVHGNERDPRVWIGNWRE
jgi:type II secretory pathway pseudopilin PulG